ncbi:XRE family transcriptional regulator [Roseitalea porphyridii]|uniref:XRE family transcriptional regulator n=1 Tax=Roseitalea porphyridii TaxID=1852022 RepID=A0A4P6V5G6_9HYPH|nr:XRE family transcriptional regulator [Roseitalea porphyridii]
MTEQSRARSIEQTSDEKHPLRNLVDRHNGDTVPVNRSLTLSTTVRQLRLAAGLTLNQLAKRSALAPSTLSKIENGQMSPTYDSIVSLASGLGVDVGELFEGKSVPAISGRRAITRRGEGIKHSTGHYDYEMLCTDLANKKFVPLLSEIKANSTQSFSAMISHAGEEFFYVLSGEVTLHTEHYAPARLGPGDSCYFDSTMGHALVSTGDEPATVLWICSQVSGALAE